MLSHFSYAQLSATPWTTSQTPSVHGIPSKEGVKDILKSKHKTSETGQSECVKGSYKGVCSHQSKNPMQWAGGQKRCKGDEAEAAEANAMSLDFTINNSG